MRIILTLLAAATVLVSSPRPAAAEAAFIGMQVQGLSAEAAAALGMEKAHGVLVRDVTLGGPSAAAGFRRGDLIVRLDSKDIDTFERLVEIVRTLEAGTKFQVTVLRRGETVNLPLETGKWPAAWRVNDKAFAAFPNIGLTVASMSDKLRRALGIDGCRGDPGRQEQGPPH